MGVFNGSGAEFSWCALLISKSRAVYRLVNRGRFQIIAGALCISASRRWIGFANLTIAARPGRAGITDSQPSAFFAGLDLEERDAPDHPGAVAVGAANRLDDLLIFPEGKHQFEIQIALFATKVVSSHFSSRIKSVRQFLQSLCAAIAYLACRRKRYSVRARMRART